MHKKLENQIINKWHPTSPLRPRCVYLSPSLCLLHNMFGWAEGLTPRVSWTVTVSPNFSDSLGECDLIITDRKKTSSPFNQTLQDTTGSRECRYLESGCETELRERQVMQRSELQTSNGADETLWNTLFYITESQVIIEHSLTVCAADKVCALR